MKTYNEKSIQCIRLRKKIRDKAYSYFDEGLVWKGLELVDRYNYVTKLVYTKEKVLTPGQFLDIYIELREFESKF